MISPACHLRKPGNVASDLQTFADHGLILFCDFFGGDIKPADRSSISYEFVLSLF